MIAKGLAGIAVDESAISDIDGHVGRLRYRGYAIEELVHRSFSDVAYLIIEGEWPAANESKRFSEILMSLGRIEPARAHLITAVGRLGLHPMTALQGVIPLLGNDHLSTHENGLQIAARIPHALALLGCNPRHANEPNAGAIVYPNEINFARRALQLLTGSAPTTEAARAFEQVQILQLEHSFNASTFAARVVASTLAPISDCITAAVGALHGPLHGGADEAAIRMAQAIGTIDDVEPWFEAARARGEKIPGIGHREYQVKDPRAKLIETIVSTLVTDNSVKGFDELQILRAIEALSAKRLQEQSKPLHPNIEFYKGIVLLAVGIEPQWFTTLFAAARVFGYVAHVIEAQANNRIIRPQAQYIGQSPRSLATG